MAPTKGEYLAYRRAARETIEKARTTQEKLAIAENVSITLFANVQPCAEGAFVETYIWIPKEKMKSCM